MKKTFIILGISCIIHFAVNIMTIFGDEQLFEIGTVLSLYSLSFLCFMAGFTCGRIVAEL